MSPLECFDDSKYLSISLITCLKVYIKDSYGKRMNFIEDLLLQLGPYVIGLDVYVKWQALKIYLSHHFTNLNGLKLTKAFGT